MVSGERGTVEHSARGSRGSFPGNRDDVLSGNCQHPGCAVHQSRYAGGCADSNCYTHTDGRSQHPHAGHSHSHGEGCADEDADSDQTDSHSLADGRADYYGDSAFDAWAYRHPVADSHRYCDRDGTAYAVSHRHAVSDRQSGHKPNADAYTDTDQNAGAYARADRHAHADAHSYTAANFDADASAHCQRPGADGYGASLITILNPSRSAAKRQS